LWRLLWMAHVEAAVDAIVEVVAGALHPRNN
jgi:hypothetical protein